MGIPFFYKWLVTKYPRIVSPAKEEPSPDGIGYDNLYLDMNYIVCPPMTASEVFESMFQYLDRLFCIVRPRRLLYLAMALFLAPK
nr:unnamed protein product [Digitaria exilis]